MIDNFVSLELQNHINIYYQICEVSLPFLHLQAK